MRSDAGLVNDVTTEVGGIEPETIDAARKSPDEWAAKAREHLEQEIRSLGKKAGYVLNPGTPVEVVDPVFDLLDLVLIMTVNPGVGGQAFLASQLPMI